MCYSIKPSDREYVKVKNFYLLLQIFGKTLSSQNHSQKPLDSSKKIFNKCIKDWFNITR